jgi:bis(5'-nucleosyl)-tetraphosphatase (symmetrical)
MNLLIGDIQGCDDPLERLLSLAGFSPSRHRLVALGDLVNRGPASLSVLRRLRHMEGAAQCLLGNHDLHLLAVAHGVRRPHRRDTFGDVLAATDRQAWIDWIATWPLALRADHWLCAHAGIPPGWDAAQALSLSEEVHELLRGPGRQELLLHMYGDAPTLWSDGLRGHDRWRYIVNAFTRMRFCEADGALELKTKEGAGAAPEGCVPWFEVAGRRTHGQPIAFGHWSTLGAIDRPDLLSLDTGCAWGGRLSAVWVHDHHREWIQVPCNNEGGQAVGRVEAIAG